MAKNYFKVRISQFMTEELNKLIKDSTLPNNLKKPMHSPSSKLFTSIVTINENHKSLNYKIKDIFIIGKETEILQKRNFKVISKIFEYFENNEEVLSENLLKIREFLEMKYEDLIKMFYDSGEFKIFKEKYKTKYFNDGAKAQEGFSLLENNGLIHLFKVLKKKKKRD